MIQDGARVTIHYQLMVEGQVMDSSEGREPLTYTQGAGQIVVGLEKHLQQLNPGDSTEVSVSPEEAYGVHSPEAVQSVPRDAIEAAERLKVGMVLQGTAEGGRTFSAVVKEVSEDSVTLDLNHPLAGKTLDFAVQIVSVD